MRLGNLSHDIKSIVCHLFSKWCEAHMNMDSTSIQAETTCWHMTAFFLNERKNNIKIQIHTNISDHWSETILKSIVRLYFKNKLNLEERNGETQGIFMITFCRGRCVSFFFLPPLYYAFDLDGTIGKWTRSTERIIHWSIHGQWNESKIEQFLVKKHTNLVKKSALCFGTRNIHFLTENGSEIMPYLYVIMNFLHPYRKCSKQGNNSMHL